MKDLPFFRFFGLFLGGVFLLFSACDDAGKTGSPEERTVTDSESGNEAVVDATADAAVSLNPNEVHAYTHDDEITTLAMSPDGRFIVSGSQDGEVRAVDAKNGFEPAGSYSHDEKVWSVDVSPDAGMMASGSVDSRVRVSDLDRNLEKVTVYSHREVAFQVKFSPEGTYLASAGSTFLGVNVIRLDDSYPNTFHVSRKGNVNRNGLAFSSDGRYLAFGTDFRGTVVVVSPGNEFRKAASFSHRDTVNAVDFSPEGRYLATVSSRSSELGSGPYEVRVVEPGKDFRTVASYTQGGELHHMVFGQYLVSGSSDGEVRVVNPDSGFQTTHTKIHRYAISALDITGNGRYVAAGFVTGTVRILDNEQNFATVGRYSHDDRVTDLTFSPDGEYVVSGADDGEVRVMKLGTK